MHPILGDLRRLAVYLVVWIPLTALVAGLMIYSGGLDWTRAVIMAVPLCVIYAFDCLGAWYLCKATPMETSGVARLLTKHLVAGSVTSGIWVLLAKGLADLMTASSANFAGLNLQ